MLCSGSTWFGFGVLAVLLFSIIWQAWRWLATGFSMFALGGLLFSFVFFSWVMPVTATNATMAQIDYLAKKTAVFVVVMILPFYSFGRLLTTIYQLRREDIGSIYAADLLGAALACAIASVNCEGMYCSLNWAS